MKNCQIAAMAILASLVLFSFTGCPQKVEQESMTFTDANGEKKFTISENFAFSVVFIKAFELEGFEPFPEGMKVAGSILETTGKWNENFTGKAKITSPDWVAIILAEEEITIGLEYNAAKTTVKVSFPNSESDDEIFAAVASELMAGTYAR